MSEQLLQRKHYMRTVRTLIISSLFALTLSSCGGGGGGGGGGTPTPTPAVQTSFPMSASEAMTINGGNFISGASTSNGAQVSVTSPDGVNVFVNVNIPLASGSYTHSFNLTTAVADQGLAAPFLLMKDSNGGVQNLLILNNTLNFSVYGLWETVTGTTTNGLDIGSIGGIAFGNTTPASGIPTSGTAAYNGTTIGAAVDGSTQKVLVGTVSLTANFPTMMINGSFNINSVGANNTTTPWATLTMPNTSIASGVAGGPYNGTLSGNLPTGAITAGEVKGSFNGPAAQETAGVWAATDGITHAVGAYGAHR
jgi:hypothetical protein